jgi:predicted RNA-binding protein YlxR (DUF448 family)
MKSSSSSYPLAARPAPQRTCLGCRGVKAKQQLVRLVRDREGHIEIDTTGRKAGRGAYICPDLACWEKALKGRQLERSLRGNLTPADRAGLLERAEDLIKGVD